METRLRNRILELVNNSTGIKGVELATCIAMEFLGFTGDEILEQIEGLVKEGSIIAVEYILPQMNYRTKVIYFPKGTVVNFLQIGG